MNKKIFNPLLNLFKKTHVGNKSIFTKNGTGLNLRSVIKNSYNPQDSIGDFVIDKDLSGKRSQVYINPETNQLLYSIAGTRSGTDIINDARAIGGGLKNTQRYKHADNVLKTAKEKYPDYATTLVGHSLSGAIASRISSAGDRTFTYNSANLLGKDRDNVVAIRHKNDPISVLGTNSSINFGGVGDLNAHSSDRLRGENIFI